jgi:8-oxo-dGTP diphosphatase
MTPPPMATPRVAAGALFFDDQGRLLLVKPTYKSGWEIPGGYVEPGETPTQACQREAREELGLERPAGRALAVDWAPSEKEGDKLLFIFDGGRLSDLDQAAIVLPSDELEAFAFHAVEDVDSLLIDRLARRVHAAVQARRAGETMYLEHGVPLTTRPTDWWTTEEVAEFLKVSSSTVRSYLARQQMPEPDRRFGRLPVWQPETVKAWNAARPRRRKGTA